MAKEKLPLEDPKTGIHRAKLWEIAFYALNNTSTNLYMILMGSISYFLIGIVGVGVVLASSLVTIMRIWDGVTDPFIGMLVDNTNTKFGKNRPFIVIGNVILFVTSYAIFHLIPAIAPGARFITYILLYMVYIVGYTFQCVVTKSAQSCVTNDPKQRPIFTMFDASYNTIAMSIIYPVWLTGTLVPNFTIVEKMEDIANGAVSKIEALIAQNPNLATQISETKDEAGEVVARTLSAFYNPAMWNHMQLVIGVISALFAVLAIIGISRKDNVKYFGIGKVIKISFKDYLDVLAHNRGIQMLIVAASSDKLSMNILGNSTITICLYGIIFGNYALNASVSAISGIPVVLFGIFGIGYVARNLGQKKCLVVGTWGALISIFAMMLMIMNGQNLNLAMPSFSLTNLSTWGGLLVPSSWSFWGLVWLLLYIAMKGFSSMSGNIVIPMTADCADYEVYRSKRYVPGLMGTLFSFVDKLISSLAATIVGVMFAAIGFKDTLPVLETPYSTSIMWITVACFVIAPAIGWILNIIAMKFYPLSKEKMASIQDEIAAIKAEAAKQ